MRPRQRKKDAVDFINRKQWPFAPVWGHNTPKKERDGARRFPCVTHAARRTMRREWDVEHE